MRSVFIAILTVILSVFGYAWVTSPNIPSLKNCLTGQLFQVKVCPEGSKYWRVNQLPSYLIRAVVISEDANFYGHNGFDWYELKQAAVTNLKAKSWRRGGSTITQQLVKNLFLSEHKNLWRKFREAIITYQVEQSWSKDQILTLYLNMIEWGPEIYGIHAASDYYFSRHPDQLNISHAIALAAIIPNPRTLGSALKASRRTPDFLRRCQILAQRMKAYKIISYSEYHEVLSFCRNETLSDVTLDNVVAEE